MSEDRFVDIETRVAHQDQALLELSDALAGQQDAIMRLERLVEALGSRLADMVESAAATGGDGHEVPPHY